MKKRPKKFRAKTLIENERRSQAETSELQSVVLDGNVEILSLLRLIEWAHPFRFPSMTRNWFFTMDDLISKTTIQTDAISNLTGASDHETKERLEALLLLGAAFPDNTINETSSKLIKQNLQEIEEWLRESHH